MTNTLNSIPEEYSGCEMVGILFSVYSTKDNLKQYRLMYAGRSSSQNACISSIGYFYFLQHLIRLILKVKVNFKRGLPFKIKFFKSCILNAVWRARLIFLVRYKNKKKEERRDVIVPVREQLQINAKEKMGEEKRRITFTIRSLKLWPRKGFSWVEEWVFYILFYHFETL